MAARPTQALGEAVNQVLGTDTSLGATIAAGSVVLFGIATLAIVTVVAPNGRGAAIIALTAFALVAALWKGRASAFVAAAVMTLAASEYSANKLADILDRESFGSVWASPILDRFSS